MPRFVNALLKIAGVLAVLFIIAAVLFPLFAKPRGGDLRSIATCASNMKHLGLGLIQYQEDYDERMPNISDKNGQTWRSAIYPYVKDTFYYQCPDRDQTDHDANPIGTDGYPQSYAMNYSGNYGATEPDKGRGAFAGPGSEPVALADIRHPEELIALVETAYNSAPEYNIDNAAKFSPASRHLWAGHHGTGCYLLMDGHVKYLRPLTTYQVHNGKVVQNLWYRDGTQPFSANGVAVLQDAQRRFAP